MGGYNFDKDLFRKRVRELVKLDSKVAASRMRTRFRSIKR